MDIQITTHSKPKYGLYIAVIFVVVVIASYSLLKEPSLVLSREELSLSEVKQRDFSLQSQAFGEFFSAKEFMLTSQASGKVSAIFQRPGALVSKDTVILELTNPELKQRHATADAEFVSQQAQLESFELEQQNDKLDYQGRIADINAALERAQLDLRVNKELSQRGVSAKLEILRAELQVKQQQQRLAFEKQKYQQFLKMQAFQLKQQQLELKQKQDQALLLAEQIEDMRVKAGIDGRLQNLDVELGESLSQGASLGRVGSDKELLVRLRVPQHQADMIKIGSPVELMTKKGTVSGEVNRVESVVNNGVVLAEVKLLSQPPSDARPAAPVTGQIFLKQLQQALYIDQVPGITPRSQKQMFVLTDSGEVAERRTIEFGDISNGRVLITSGLSVGEKLITRAKDNWKSFTQLTID